MNANTYIFTFTFAFICVHSWFKKMANIYAWSADRVRHHQNREQLAEQQSIQLVALDVLDLPKQVHRYEVDQQSNAAKLTL